jgi:hypothetical protein
MFSVNSDREQFGVRDGRCRFSITLTERIADDRMQPREHAGAQEHEPCGPGKAEAGMKQDPPERGPDARTSGNETDHSFALSQRPDSGLRCGHNMKIQRRQEPLSQQGQQSMMDVRNMKVCGLTA